MEYAQGTTKVMCPASPKERLSRTGHAVVRIGVVVHRELARPQPDSTAAVVH